MKSILRQFIDSLKPFRVVCSNGTDRRTWTLSGARSLLCCCGKVAIIGKYNDVVEFRIND